MFEVTSTEHVVQFFSLDMRSAEFSCNEELRLSQHCFSPPFFLFFLFSLKTLFKSKCASDLKPKVLPDRVHSGLFVEQLQNSPERFAATFGVKSYVLFVWEVGWCR